MNSKQTIKSGDDSTAVQIQNVNIYLANPEQFSKDTIEQAITTSIITKPDEIRNQTKATIYERQNNFANKFVEGIKNFTKENLDKFAKRFAEPDMQLSIENAQKSYAKYGDNNKLEQLINLLLKKGTEKPESMKNYLIDKALETVPMLTQKQLEYLMFLMYRRVFIESDSIQEIYDKHIAYLVELSDAIDLSPANIEYLEQLTLIKRPAVRITNPQFISIIKEQYNEHFTKLFSRELSEPEILKLFTDINPQVAEVFQKAAPTTPITLNPLGSLIALQNAEIKNKQKIDWPFE